MIFYIVKKLSENKNIATAEKLRIFGRYTAYCLKFRRTIPASVINLITIRENFEPLVDLKTITGFFFDESIADSRGFKLRKAAADRLVKAQKRLPDGIYFKIYSAFRPLSLQQKLWSERRLEIQKKFPDLSEEEINRKTKAICADPRKGFGGHQTGGAIDLTLCDKDGRNLDMGDILAPEVPTGKTATFCSHIDLAAQEKRRVLYKAMTDCGFVNYPNEWWHYCFNDRMWAAYSGLTSCGYGLIEKD